jgi:hypothetical protein
VSPAAEEGHDDRDVTLRAACELFDAGRYLAAHELFEELWEATEGEESDFFKGLIQASIALHHFESGNLEGAAKLYSGHRSLLARYQPAHAGVDVTGFLAAMRACFRPVLERAGDRAIPFPARERPRLLPGR